MGNAFEEYLDENDVVGEVVLLRAAKDKTILIVEGPSDDRFFSIFVDAAATEIVIARGREKALAAIAILRTKFSGILCVVDRDYDSFIGQDPTALDVIVTDEHDLEMILMRSSAFERVLTELASKRKLKNLMDSGETPWSVIEPPAHALGTLRLYSKEHNLNLRFDGLRYRFLDRRTLEFEPKALITEVFGHSQRLELSVEDAVAFLQEWTNKPHDRHLMCCGHDCAFVLGRALQAKIGSQQVASTVPDEIESRLRLAYSRDEFLQSKLHADIVEWEQSNAPYHCLRMAA